MRIMQKAKDGGPDSPVDAYFLIEWKSIFSIALLKFNKGGREEFHTHAFNALTWFLLGDLVEENIDGSKYKYGRSLFPKITKRNKNHRVNANVDSWCLTVRGPWGAYWTEYNSVRDITKFLSNKRKVVREVRGYEKL